MNNCYAAHNRVIRSSWVAIVTGLLINAILIPAGVMMLTEDALGLFLLIASLDIAITLYCAASFIFWYRKYEVNSKGITIQYLNKFTVFYPWENMHLVCVCCTHTATSGNIKDTVIWLSTKRLPNSPPADRSIWHTTDYDLLHSRSLIIIDFSDEQLEEIQKFYKKEIPDYR